MVGKLKEKKKQNRFSRYEFFLIALPCSDLLTSTSQVEPFKVGRDSVSLWLLSLFIPITFPQPYSIYIHVYTRMYVYVCACIMYMCVYIIRFISLPSYIAFLGKHFKAVVTPVPFALYKDFSKSGLCQSYKPLPLWFSFWCWRFLTTCCFWISNSQTFTSLSIWLLLNHSYLFHQ